MDDGVNFMWVPNEPNQLRINIVQDYLIKYELNLKLIIFFKIKFN